ncbi:13910_t:CDS:2 [Racocetra persica]|uniref:13910_t:CDS:1 n=1 Tax=Racocetra persica TaxID=160502 RepID=A0ACA9KLL4_9GLOM|nr:13910_t:CDS:2 [Racocetra persica]
MLTEGVEDESKGFVGTTKDQTKNELTKDQEESKLMKGVTESERKDQTESEILNGQMENELMKNQTKNEFAKDQTKNELVKDQMRNEFTKDQTKNELVKNQTDKRHTEQLDPKYKDALLQEKFANQNDQQMVQESIAQAQITKAKIKKVRFSEITESQLDEDDVHPNYKASVDYGPSQSSGFYEPRHHKIERHLKIEKTDVTLTPEKASKLFGKLGLAEAWEKFVSPKSQNKKKHDAIIIESSIAYPNLRIYMHPMLNIKAIL